MAQVTLNPPDTIHRVPNTGDSPEFGDSYKTVIDALNSMLTELYLLVAGAGAAMLALSITGTDSSLDIAGQAAAQGGSTNVAGGASSTTGNAGGAATVTGGAPGATGVGGAATVTGAAGGATSGTGGAATVTAGAGTAGNAAGGVASQTGGAGQGSAAGGVSKNTGGAGGATGAGGKAQSIGGAGGATSGTGGAAEVTGGAGTNGNAVGGAATIAGGAGNGTGTGGVASLTGGASGAGATGNGAAAQVTGGAALSSNGSGGSVVLTPGAKTGTGIAGGVRSLGVQIFKQAAPAAKTTAVTLTGAEVVAGLITANQGGGIAANYQMPTGQQIQDAMPADWAASGGIDEAFEFTLVNISTNASEDITITTNTDITLVGNVVVASNAAVADQAWGTFRVRKTADHVMSVYRVG